MKVVVTGASGFVGRHVVDALAAKGFDVVAVSRRPFAVPDSVRNSIVLDYGAETPSGDVLVHLAETNSLATVSDSESSERKATIDRLEGLLQKGYAHVIYGSSAAVYGDGASVARSPSERVVGGSPYAKLKLDCESRILEVGGCALRFANLYGPGMSSQNVLSKVLQQVGRDGALEVWDLAPVRDYLWVEDAAQCVAAMIGAGAHGAYNSGSGRGTSVRDLVSIVLAAAGESDRQVVATQPRNVESSLILDITLTQSVCGWRPQTSLEAGIMKMLEFRK